MNIITFHPNYNQARSLRNTTIRETSIHALNSNDEETVTQQRSAIYHLIKERGGLTCWEVEKATGGLHQTISSRITYLTRARWLHDTGVRRPTGSGRMAIVWGVVEQ